MSLAADEPGPDDDFQPPSVFDEAGEEAEDNWDDESGEEPADGVPETYEPFQVADGVTMDEGLIERAAPVFKELGLPQAGAQKLVDLWAGVVSDAAQADERALQDYNAALIRRVKEDPMLGGPALKQNLATAKRAIERFGSGELDRLLQETGFGNQPEVLRFLVKVGKFDADDRLERGGQAPSGRPRFGDFYNPEIMKDR